MENAACEYKSMICVNINKKKYINYISFDLSVIATLKIYSIRIKK